MKSSPTNIPKLDIRMPVRLGFLVIVIFFGAGVGGAAMAPIDKGVSLPGTIIVESKVKSVQHERGGTVGSIHVTEGQTVEAGDILVTLNTKSLAEQISALKAQADAAARQLDLARQEAETMMELQRRRLAARSKVLGLQRQVAEIEKEVAALDARIAVAEQELSRSVIRSPVAGRVLRLHVNGPGAVLKAAAVVAEIVPETDRLVIEGRLSPNAIDSVKQDMPAKVWLTALSWREQRPIPARLKWVSPDSVEDRRTGASYYIARVELSKTVKEIAKTVELHPGMRAEILLMTGKHTLLDQLIDPLMRNLNRAFRE